MPLHDWDWEYHRWEGMRLFWMTELARELRGSLPPGYRAVFSEPHRYYAASGLVFPDWVADRAGVYSLDGMRAIADRLGTQFVDLIDLEVEKSVLDLVPESLARENLVLPLELEGNTTLKLITANLTDCDTIQRIQFILNKDLWLILAVREQILEAINRHYRSESVFLGSMVTELTNTVLDLSGPESCSLFVEREGRLVAAIELISPRNKDRPTAREQYAARYLNYLRGGVHLLLVDVHRRPLDFGFGQLIAEGLGEKLPAPAAPSALSYRVGAAAAQGGRMLGVWQHALAIGKPLPAMPLPLCVEEAVMVDLESTYSRAAADSYVV